MRKAGTFFNSKTPKPLDFNTFRINQQALNIINSSLLTSVGANGHSPLRLLTAKNKHTVEIFYEIGIRVSRLTICSAINNEQLIINNYPFLKRIGLTKRKIFDLSP